MTPTNTQLLLTETTLLEGVAVLCQQDDNLAAVVQSFGPPPLWAREQGFATLVHIILEQQVSLASAKAAFDRLVETLRDVTPDAFVSLDDDQLRTIGFSRQKTSYCRGLAESILCGDLCLESIEGLDDESAKNELIRLRGIGPWTADIYLLMVLRRPDIWPRGDLALNSSFRTLRNLDQSTTDEMIASEAIAWQPLRAVAARILWHSYLSRMPTKHSA